MSRSYPLSIDGWPIVEVKPINVIWRRRRDAHPRVKCAVGVLCEIGVPSNTRRGTIQALRCTTADRGAAAKPAPIVEAADPALIVPLPKRISADVYTASPVTGTLVVCGASTVAALYRRLTASTILPTPVSGIARASAPVVKASNGPVVRLVIQPVAEAVIQPVVEPVVKAVLKTLVEPRIEAVIEAIVEAVLKTLIESRIETVIEAVVEPILKALVEPRVEAVIEPIVETVLKAFIESGIGTAIEPAIEPVVEPILKTLVAPPVEAVIEAIVKLSTRPVYAASRRVGTATGAARANVGLPTKGFAAHIRAVGAPLSGRCPLASRCGPTSAGAITPEVDLVARLINATAIVYPAGRTVRVETIVKAITLRRRPLVVQTAVDAVRSPLIAKPILVEPIPRLVQSLRLSQRLSQCLVLAKAACAPLTARHAAPASLDARSRPSAYATASPYTAADPCTRSAARAGASSRLTRQTINGDGQQPATQSGKNHRFH